MKLTSFNQCSSLLFFIFIHLLLIDSRKPQGKSSAESRIGDQISLRRYRRIHIPNIDSLTFQNTKKKLNLANPLARFGRNNLSNPDTSFRFKQEEDVKMSYSEKESSNALIAKETLNATRNSEVNTINLKNLLNSNSSLQKKSKEEPDPSSGTSSVTPTPKSDQSNNQSGDTKSSAASSNSGDKSGNQSKSDLKIKIGESKNYGDGERTVVAETSGLASVGDDISLNTLNALNLKAPKIIPSFTYEDAKIDGSSAQEADSKAQPNKEVYYDPRSGVLGDIKICSNIQDPYFCVKQNVCGWCGEYNMCIAGNILKPLQKCSISTYTYTSYVGEKAVFINYEKEDLLINSSIKPRMDRIRKEKDWKADMTENTTTMMYEKDNLPKRYTSFREEKTLEYKKRDVLESSQFKKSFSQTSELMSLPVGSYNYYDMKSVGKTAPVNDKSQEMIKVLSYNLLADSFLYRNDGSTWYPYTDQRYLETNYRYNLMVNQIKIYDADIICLQEVDKLKEFFGPKLQEMNYEIVYQNKAEKPDFLLIGWKKDKLELVKQESIIFKEKIPDGLKNNADFEKGDISVIAHLRSLATKSIYFVINSHMFWNQRKESVQFFQASLIKQYILKNLTASDKLVLCGDFNSFPFSNVFRLLCFNSQPELSYSRNKEYYNEKEMNYIYDLFIKPYLKDMKIYSAYGLYQFDKLKNKYKHPYHTQFSRSANGCVDYIFYLDKSKMRIINLLKMPSDKILTQEEAIPNRYFPSDHLPILAEFLSE